MISLVRVAALVGVALLLTACAGWPAATSPEALPSLGPALETFMFSGRLAVRQGARSDHLRFDWEHAPGSDTLLLTTPLGQGVARVHRDADNSSLDTADGQHLMAANWKTLTQQIFGIELPLDELTEWLRGARPKHQDEIAGWRIRVTEVSPSRQHRLLPRVLEISKEDIEVRLVVDERGDSD